MPGRTYHPLETVGSPSELDIFRDTAKSGDVLDELIGLTLPDTGIRNGAMAHMQDGWIQLNGQRPEIHVPLAEDCSIGTGTGRGGDTTKGGKSCSICRNRAEKDWAPDGADWTPKSENGNRTIPVRDEDTIRILKNYFKIHDNVCGQNTVTSRVKSIADRAGLERKVTPHDLRDTYGTRLALKGFSPYDIRDLMGHANLEQALDYIKLSGAQVHRQYDDLW